MVWCVDKDIIQKHRSPVLFFQYRPVSSLDKLICRATMSAHCHSGLLFKSLGGENLVHFDTHPNRGVSLQSLDDVIRKYGGTVDVYHLEPHYSSRVDYDLLGELALSFVGLKYGWFSITRIVAANTPFVWGVVKTSIDDEGKTKGLPTCSQLIAYITRRAGLDLVPRTPDWMVVPGDLTKCLALRYDGCLTSNKTEVLYEPLG